MKFITLSLLAISVSLVAGNPTPDPKPDLAPWGSGYSSSLTFGSAYKSCGSYRPFCCKRKEHGEKGEKEKKYKEGEKEKKYKEGKGYGKEYYKKEYHNEKKGKGYREGYKVKYGEGEYECECEEFYGKLSHSGWRLGKIC